MASRLFASLLVISLSATLIYAAGAPAATSLELRITKSGNSFNGCVGAGDTSNGNSAIILNCADASGFPTIFSWGLEHPGASSDIGTPTAIRIFGNKCLDVTNGANANGTRVQIFSCTSGDANQMWNVNADNTITWAGTNKCLDLTNGVLGFGTALQIWTCVPGSTNQQWIPTVLSSINTEIQLSNPSNPNFTPCISATTNANGAPAVIQNCGRGIAVSGSATLVAQPSGYGPIVTFGNKCLDVTNGVNANGTLLQWWTCSGGPNQLWSIVFSGGQPQALQWVGTNKCVDLTNGVQATGTQLQLWTCANGNSHQAWSVTVSDF